jgi:hypothetical protein
MSEAIVELMDYWQEFQLERQETSRELWSHGKPPVKGTFQEFMTLEEPF